MRRAWLGLLLLLFVVMAPAQHGGGRVAGGRVPGARSPFTNATGAHANSSWGLAGRTLPCVSWQGCRGAPPFWPNRFAPFVYPPVALYSMGWPGFNGAGYFGEPDPFYPGQPEAPYYAPPTFNATTAPASQDAVQVPNAPDGGPGGITNNDEDATDAKTSSEAAEYPTNRAGNFQFYQVPTPPPDPNIQHPPIVVLKTGWAYSVLKHWVKGKTFYFITTQGEEMQVPVAQLVRIYPGSTTDHAQSPRSPGTPR